MRKIYLLFAVLLCFTFTQGYSQITYSENFDGGLGGWTTTGTAGFSTTTTTPCTGTGSVRANVYSTNPDAALRSPVLSSSNGGPITLDFGYKIINWSGGAATPNPWGSFTVQYATATSGPWTTVHTVDAANHTPAATCATKSFVFTPPTGDIYIRFNATWAAGSGADYYLYFDEVNITQGAAPACVMPGNLSSNTVTTTSANITWDASPSGSASGYEWEIRTSGAGGSGATGLTASGNTTAATLTASSNTLTANTAYSVYVRTNCGGTYSVWAGPYGFSTLCASESIPTAVQSFDNATIPACWSRSLITGTNAWAPVTTNDGVPSPRTGARFMGKEYNNSDALLFSQPINMTSAGPNGARINVWIYRNDENDATDRIRFHINTTADLSGATQLLEIFPEWTVAPVVTADGWYNYKADIPASFNTEPVVYIIAQGTTTGGFASYGLGFDDFKVETIPTCEEPTGLIFSGITTTSAQLEWTAPAATSPVNYQIYHSTSNVAPTGSSTPTITGASSPATISSLAPGTKYYVWVRSNCGTTDGVSVWTAMDSVTTECTPVTSFTENFDGVTTPSLPACWGKFLRGTAGTANVTTSTASVNSAPNGVLLANSSSTASADIMLVSRPLSNTGAGTHRLRFWARNATASQDIEVGTLDNKSSSATFSLVQAIDISTTYTEYTVDFTSYSGTDPYIAIRRLSTSTFTSVYIDNIVWEVIPTCDAPSAVVFPTIGNNSAEVEWTAPTLGSPVDYQIYYSTTNTAPTGASTPNVTGANSPATITGLTANTLYYVWVRTNCGAGGVSSWSNVASFTTACDPVSTLPWTENFDALATTGTTTFPSCWKKENGDWRTSNAAFASQNDPRSTPNYLTNSWNATNEFMWTPGFVLTAGTSYDFSFWWTGDTYNGWTGDVFYNNTQNSTSATQLGGSFITASTTSVAQYVQFKESFTPSATGTYYFAIRINANGTPWYLGFDDFKLEVTPSCGEPTAIIANNLTTSGAQVEWTPPTTGSPVNYQVYYSTSSTVPGSGATPNLTGQTSPATITGLSANTTYYLWVRTNCGGTDLSSWGGPVTFTTPCSATAVPYSQNFESATVPGLPTCTSRENAGTGNNWVTSTAPGSGFTSKTLQYGYTLTNAANAWFYTQGLNLTGGTSYQISYRYGNNNSTYTEKLEVKYGTSPSAASMTDLIADHPTINNAAANSAVYDFTPATTGVYYIGFHVYSDANQWNLYVDDISVIVSPTCGNPTSLVVSGVTPTAAQVDWTAPSVGSVTNYSWELRSSGAAGSGATGLVSSGNTATTTVNFTTLTAATTYTFYVRTNCTSPDVSTWASVIVSTAPANDECADAITVVNATPVNGTTVGSNPSMPADACATAGVADDDVWYKFTATYAGNASIAVTNVSATLDVVIVAYSGTCGSFTSIGCADGPGNGGSETAALTGLNAGETYYFRVWSYGAGAASNGTFTVTVTGSAVFPVTLVNFSGEKAGSANKLIWSTSTEVNNRGFELERSADGRNFTGLTFVNSKAENGNSNSLLNYSYIDARPLSGNNYYRLKQIDKDGKTTYSDIVVLKAKATEITLSSVYPNPATRELNMIITSPRAEKVTIVVTDLTGKMIMQQNAQLVIGDNQSQMNVQQLAAGTYLIKAICANGCETAVQRFVKH